MPHYSSYDGARLAYRVLPAREGAGALPPLLCLAGGPGRDAAYLGDLGGLDARRDLIVPDARGTGGSPPAEDPTGYAFPSLAEDLEALRRHLGLERIDLLGHSAGAATAQAYAAARPEHLARLVLVTPGSRLQGELPDDARDIFASRAHEPWWPDAKAAVERLEVTADLEEVRGLLLRAAPMGYGRWDEPQRAHAASQGEQLGPVARAGFWQGVDEAAQRAIVARLREVACPVLVLTGESDAMAGTRAGDVVAACFPRGRVVRLPGVGHYPWVDEPELFRRSVEDFLAAPPAPEAEQGPA